MTNNRVDYLITLKDLFTGGIRKATSETEKLNGAVMRTQSSFSGLGSAISAAAIGYFVKGTVDAAAKMETLNNVINYTSIDSKDAAVNHKFLKDEIESLKLPLIETTEGFSSFSAAMLGSKLQGEGARKIFDGVATASTAMHLSAQQNSSVFLALNQIMSKGKLQAQELTLQLAQALPGAQRIAAKAMGMTTAEFMKQMEAGNILAEDFLPKFAATLKQEFGSAIPNAVKSMQSSLTDASNKWLELKVTIGEMFMPVFQVLLNAFSRLGKWIQENRPLFTFMVVSFVTLASIITVVTAAQWALNTAMAFAAGLTGVGWIAIAAAGAAALAVGLYAAKNAQDSLNSSAAIGNAMHAAVSPMASGATQTGQTSKATKKSGTQISAVEARGHQNFNIDIKKLVETLNINTTNLKESGAAIKAEVTKALIGAVNDFQLMAVK